MRSDGSSSLSAPARVRLGLLSLVMVCALAIWPGLGSTLGRQSEGSGRDTRGTSAGHWTIEAVDTAGDVGYSPALVFDADGYPRVSYYDATSGTLKLGYRDPWSWHTWWLGGAPVFGAVSDMAVNSQGLTRIAYWDATRNKLVYSHETRTGWSSWEFEDVHTAVQVQQARILVDAQGYPRILYTVAAAGEGQLWYAYRDASAWHRAVVTRAVILQYCSLALDADGHPHVAYAAQGAGTADGALFYGEQVPGGAWNLRSVLSGAELSAPSLALDGAGSARIAYAYRPRGSSDWELRYVERAASSWQEETLEPLGVGNTQPCLVLDRNGWPHISYHHPSLGTLMYRYRDPSGWHVASVDPTSSAVAESRLRLDNAGQSWIVYRVAAGRDLKCARWQADGTPTPTLVLRYTELREAELGELVAPMAKGADPLASACGYAASAAAEDGMVTVRFSVPTAGNYYLWGRAKGLAWNRNSFWVSLDGGAEFWYEVPQAQSQWTWGWDRVHASNQPAKPLQLIAGQHTVSLRAREPLSQLDAVLLTNVFDLIADEVMPCQGTPYATRTGTSTPTPTQGVTLTQTPTRSPVPSTTPTASTSPSATATRELTLTPTATARPTVTATPTVTPWRLYLPLVLLVVSG